MENKSHALAAGVFVLLVTALLFGMVAWLTRDKEDFRIYEISTREALTGLQPQAAVRYRGIAVGKVTSISFDPELKGNALVRLRVAANAPVSSATYATLNFQGITGQSFIQLDDTGASAEPLAPPPDGLPHIPLKPNLLSNLSDQGTEILQKAEDATDKINALLAAENQRALMGAITQLERLVANLNTTVVKHVDPALAGFPRLVQESEKTLLGVQDAVTALQGVAQGAGRDFGQAARSVERVTERIQGKDGLLDSADQAGQALVDMASNVNNQTLPRLNRAADSVTKTARGLGHAARGLGDNPSALLLGIGAIEPGPGESGYRYKDGKP